MSIKQEVSKRDSHFCKPDLKLMRESIAFKPKRTHYDLGQKDVSVVHFLEIHL